MSRDGVDQIRAAYEAERTQSRTKFLSKLKMLTQMPYEEWANGGTLAKDLHGACNGLRELRFLADNVQQRPLGFRSGDTEFTLVFWAHEKGGKFVERNACEKGLERKAEAMKLEDRTNALWLALE